MILPWNLGQCHEGLGEIRIVIFACADIVHIEQSRHRCYSSRAYLKNVQLLLPPSSVLGMPLFMTQSQLLTFCHCFDTIRQLVKLIKYFFIAHLVKSEIPNNDPSGLNDYSKRIIRIHWLHCFQRTVANKRPPQYLNLLFYLCKLF